MRFSTHLYITRLSPPNQIHRFCETACYRPLGVKVGTKWRKYKKTCFGVVFLHENKKTAHFFVILCASSTFTPHYMITDKGLLHHCLPCYDSLPSPPEEEDTKVMTIVGNIHVRVHSRAPVVRTPDTSLLRASLLVPNA